MLRTWRYNIDLYIFRRTRLHNKDKNESSEIKTSGSVERETSWSTWMSNRWAICVVARVSCCEIFSRRGENFRVRCSMHGFTYVIFIGIVFFMVVRRMGEKTCAKVVLRLGRWNFLHHGRAWRCRRDQTRCCCCRLDRRRHPLCRRRRTKGNHGRLRLYNSIDARRTGQS